MPYAYQCSDLTLEQEREILDRQIKFHEVRYIKCSPTALAVLDLSDYYCKGFIITRINVPEKFRGQGFGSKLLENTCKKADELDTNLYLEVLATGPLDRYALIRWYKRYGFTPYRGMWKRKPRAPIKPDRGHSLRQIVHVNELDNERKTD